MTKGKILVSWYAHNNDFVWEGTGNNRKKLPEVREDGPTMNVHRFFYEGYTKHLLLYSNEKDKLFFDQLRTHIYKEFRHDRHIIEPYLMAVNDPINVEEITHKVEKLIAGLSQYQIDIFISPGTPAMQVAWYITGSKFKAYVNLFQIRPKEFTNDKKQPVKQNITFYLADLAMNLTLTQANIENSLAREAFEITPSLLVVCKKAQQVAFTRDITCLILGEHGTGKELIAKYIHRNSDRRQQPIKAVNCSAFSDDLLRSELFGHEKGAFTGAHDKHIGLIEAADNGTLFLDEIGDISPVMQAALLRFIQLKEFIPVGGNKPKTADVRIVAATNRDLADLCKRGLFRWDLYYRLMVAEIDLPPLRERGKKEIKDMLDYFVKLYSEKYSQRKTALIFSKEALDIILNHSFPGNVRELENMVLNLYTFTGPENDEIMPDDLPYRIRYSDFESPLALEEAEKKHILHVYTFANKNISRAAATLKISRQTLMKKLNKYGVRDYNI